MEYEDARIQIIETIKKTHGNFVDNHGLLTPLDFHKLYETLIPNIIEDENLFRECIGSLITDGYLVLLPIGEGATAVDVCVTKKGTDFFNNFTK